eukprot:2899643-Alexandrium_andersonii.AAC.1
MGLPCLARTLSAGPSSPLTSAQHSVGISELRAGLMRRPLTGSPRMSEWGGLCFGRSLRWR